MFLTNFFLSCWTNNVTNFLKDTRIISPPSCHLRFSMFVREKIKLEWQCSQYQPVPSEWLCEYTRQESQWQFSEFSKFRENHQRFNWVNLKILFQFKDLCLAGTVVLSWSLTQDVAGSNSFTVMTKKTFLFQEVCRTLCVQLLRPFKITEIRFLKLLLSARNIRVFRLEPYSVRYCNIV